MRTEKIKIKKEGTEENIRNVSQRLSSESQQRRAQLNTEIHLQKRKRCDSKGKMANSKV